MELKHQSWSYNRHRHTAFNRSNQQKDNSLLNPNNDAGLSLIVTGNVIDHALDRTITESESYFSLLINKTELVKLFRY